MSTAKMLISNNNNLTTYHKLSTYNQNNTGLLNKTKGLLTVD